MRSISIEVTIQTLGNTTMPTLTTVVRAQSALLHPSRLPLFSRLVIALVAVSSILLLQSTWDIRQWGFLVPSRVGIVSGKKFPWTAAETRNSR